MRGGRSPTGIGTSRAHALLSTPAIPVVLASSAHISATAVFLLTFHSPLSPTLEHTATGFPQTLLAKEPTATLRPGPKHLPGQPRSHHIAGPPRQSVSHSVIRSMPRVCSNLCVFPNPAPPPRLPDRAPLILEAQADFPESFP